MKFKNIQNKTILITGAFGGLGRKFIKYFLESDAKLILTDYMVPADLNTLFKEEKIPSKYKNNILSVFAADLTQADSCKTIYDTVKKVAVIDILVNNAGIAAGGYFHNIPYEESQKIMQINLLAPMELTHLFLQDFTRRKSGHLVYVSSVAGYIATAYGTSYSASKFGIRGFAMSVKGEYKNSNIDVSIIYPFFTKTNIIYNSKIYGDVPYKKMPGIFKQDPDKVILNAVKGIDSKKLHIHTDFFSDFMSFANKFTPIISEQFKAEE